jgi:hypothetical protein
VTLPSGGLKQQFKMRSTQLDFLSRLIKMYIKTSFFKVLDEVKKDLQDASTGTGI